MHETLFIATSATQPTLVSRFFCDKKESPNFFLLVITVQDSLQYKSHLKPCLIFIVKRTLITI